MIQYVVLRDLPDVCATLDGQIQQVVAVYVVEVVPEVGIHHHTIDAQSGMGVYITIFEDVELLLTILYAPDVCIRLEELTELLVTRLAGESLGIETRHIGVECCQESTQVGNILTLRAFAVTEEEWFALRVEFHVAVSTNQVLDAVLEVHDVSHCPPVLILTVFVRLGTVVVEAVSEFVADVGSPLSSEHDVNTLEPPSIRMAASIINPLFAFICFLIIINCLAKVSLFRRSAKPFNKNDEIHAIFLLLFLVLRLYFPTVVL